MAGNSQARPAQSPQSSRSSASSSLPKGSPLATDTKLVVGMVMGSLFHGQGIQELIQMIKQAGPDAPNAAAHAILTGIVQARQMLEQNNMPVDNSIWVSKGGVVNQLVTEVGKILASTVDPMFVSPEFLSATAKAIVQQMQQQDNKRQAPTSPGPQEAEMPPEQPKGLAAPMGGM